MSNKAISKEKKGFFSEAKGHNGRPFLLFSIEKEEKLKKAGKKEGRRDGHKSVSNFYVPSGESRRQQTDRKE